MTATGTSTAALTAEDVDVAILDRTAGGVPVAGKVVDVQLDGRRAGFLHRRAGRSCQPPIVAPEGNGPILRGINR